MKFNADVPTHDKDTPFIRQNTPHPKELRDKAKKLLAKNRSDEGGASLEPLSEEVNIGFKKNIYLFASISIVFHETI